MDKKRFKDWLTRKENLIIIITILFALITRIYFFDLAKDQALWWDESEYMSGAKAYAGLTNYELSSIRTPGLSLFSSIFIRLGFSSEIALRFFVAFLPSLIVLILTFIMVSLMYEDKRIALIATLILSVLWEHVFYSNRFHTENLSLIFQFLAIIVLYKSYLKKDNISFIKPKFSLLWILGFSFMAFFFRPGNLIFFPALVAFIPIVNAKKLLSTKRNRNIVFAVLIAILILGFFFIQNLSNISLFASYYNPQNPIAFNNLRVFNGFYLSHAYQLSLIFLFALFLGLLISISNLWFNKKKITNFKPDDENLNLKSNIFNLMLLVSVLIYFVFFLRAENFEYRWFFPLLPAMLAFTGIGLTNFSDYAGSFLGSKNAIYIILIVLVVGGLYPQLSHTDKLIESRVNSYNEVKLSGRWMKQNSQPGDIIISASVPQHSYYTEREIVNFNLDNPEGTRDEAYFDNNIQRINPKFIVISAFEPSFTPQWAYEWPQNNIDKVRVVDAYFQDAAQQQPILIVYEYLGSNRDSQAESSIDQ